MKKVLSVLVLGLASIGYASAQENKYEFGVDFGLNTLYTNHGQESQNNGQTYGDATNAGSKLNLGFNVTNHLDKESALRMSLNVLNSNPRSGIYTNNSVDYPFNKTFESSLFDVDFINKFQLGKSNIGLLAGLRYAKTEWNSRYLYWNNNAYVATTNKFSGIGPSLGLTFNRPITDKFSALAEVKYSHLFGTVSSNAVSTSARKNATSSILDAQVGFQYTQKLEGKKSLVYGVSYSYVNFARLSNLVQHIDPEDTDYTVAGPKLSVKYLFD